MTHGDLWAMLAGARGFLPVFAAGETFWHPVGVPRGWLRQVRAFAYLGDAQVGAVPHLDPDWRLVGASNVLWARCESPKSRAALAGFAVPPTGVLTEGTARVALWALAQGLEAGWTVRLNRRLAHALGAPKKHCTTRFAFSPPGTVLRHGRQRPVAVGVESWTGGLYGARQVAGGLPDAPDPNAWKDRAGDRRLSA